MHNFPESHCADTVVGKVLLERQRMSITSSRTMDQKIPITPIPGIYKAYVTHTTLAKHARTNAWV